MTQSERIQLIYPRVATTFTPEAGKGAISFIVICLVIVAGIMLT